MWAAIKNFKDANRQTKFFVLMVGIYMLALAWTTIQAYARLEYSRSGEARPIVIQTTDQS